MNMKKLIAVFVLGLFAMIEVIEGMQIEPNMTDMRCQCRKSTTARIKNNMFKKLEIFPSATHCPVMEVIITTVNNNKICIDPSANWFNRILPKLYQTFKQKKNKTGETTVSYS